MQQLQSQIEPHFLFNTLAHIQASIRLEPDKALTLLDHLTQLMRLSLQREKQNTPKLKIPLKQEIEGLKHYIAIQQIRLEARLNVQWQIDEACLNLPVPPLILQPLVENAVIHGIEPLEEGGTLMISATCDQHHLTLMIKDTGMGMPAQQHASGLGLSNLKQRLALEYGDQAELSITYSAEGVEVKLCLDTKKQRERINK